MKQMKGILVLTIFMLATLTWAVAQQAGGQAGSSAQGTSPSSRPDASQSQSPATGATGQSQTPVQSQAATGPTKEGCLGGSNPNYTITDHAGKTYKLNIPANKDASPLASHVGESVVVMGNVNEAGGSPSIDVDRIGRGTGNCPGSGSSAQQPH